MASTTIVLPAPVSPVTTVMPGAEHQAQLGDHPEVADGQLDQHVRARRSPAAGHRSAQPELGLQDAQEVAGPERHEPGRLGGGRGR